MFEQFSIEHKPATENDYKWFNVKMSGNLLDILDFFVSKVQN